MKTRHERNTPSQWTRAYSPRRRRAGPATIRPLAVLRPAGVRGFMSFHHLDLNLLRVFDAIFQTRSVTIAASNLHLTQPAVSKQLNRLREVLDDPLFVRTNDGMAPTPRAEAIAGPIRKALNEVRFIVEQQLGFDPASSERTFRIFMSDVGQMVLLPKLLELIAREAPLVAIQTVQVPPSRMRGDRTRIR